MNKCRPNGISVFAVGCGWILALWFVVVLLSHSAYSDEYDSVLNTIQSGGSVDIIVSPEWGSILQDDPDWLTISEMQKKIIDAASKTGGKVEKVRRYRLLPIVSMTVDKAAVESLRVNNKKVQIWHDRQFMSALVESSQNVGAPKLWEIGLTGKGQYVAVLDTGVDSSHPFLKGKVAHQYEACASKTECPNGEIIMEGPGAGRASNSHGLDSHGTHVSGIIAGKNNKMSGIAPDVKIIAINVFSWNKETKDYRASESDIHFGIEHAILLKRNEGVNIAAINLSLGGEFYDSPCEDRRMEHYAKEALSEGIVIVAASGNHKENKPNEYTYGISWPACVSGILSVGAIDKKSRVTSFSQGASFLDIVAPGKSILSSTTGNPKYEHQDGTSMAAPHAAGAIAILRQAMPSATATELVAAIKNSGRVVVDPYLNLKTSILDLDAVLQRVGYKVKSAPNPQPAPMPTQAPIPAAPPKSSGGSSGGWGSIQ